MKRINIFLEPEDKARLERAAKEAGLSLSQLVRIEMRKYLAQKKQA